MTDILSATLRTISPFALVCVILPLTRTRTSKCRSNWWWSKCPAPAGRDSGTFRRHLPGRSRMQNANLILGAMWRIFFRDVAKIRSAFCISDFQRRISRFILSSSDSLSLESATTFLQGIHLPQMTSRYVILGSFLNHPL